MKGASGQSFEGWDEFTGRSFTGVYEAMTTRYLKLGPLQGREREWSTEEDRQAFVADFLRNQFEHGAYVMLGETVARKLL